MLRVIEVSIPPMSTVGFGVGLDEQDRRVHFIGDWRPMRDIGDAIAAGEEVEVDPPAWAISRREQ